MALTLSIDCGGGGIKASILDSSGLMLCPPIRRQTPYPLPPQRFVATLLEIANQLKARYRDGQPTRATVGIPGMIRHGVVVTTPHYITSNGPRSRIDPALAEAWSRFDARSALTEAFGLPTLVLNDAEVHGAGVITGAGLELVLTLGTGLGSAIFDDGHLAPHLELSQAPMRWGMTYDTYIGEPERRRLGDAFWSTRIRVMVEAMRPVVLWDRLYLGGGNAAKIRQSQLGRLGPDVTVVPNAAGIVGGARAWAMLG